MTGGSDDYTLFLRFICHLSFFRFNILILSCLNILSSVTYCHFSPDFRLLASFLQKVTFSHERVTFSHEKVTFSDEKVTFSDEKVTFSTEKVSFTNEKCKEARKKVTDCDSC